MRGWRMESVKTVAMIRVGKAWNVGKILWKIHYMWKGVVLMSVCALMLR